MENLKKYQNWLKKENQKVKVGRPETPNRFNFKTLWIPEYSGNRTACYDLNHTITGFRKDLGYLVGENANCGTTYVIIEVPKNWQHKHLNELSERICKILQKDDAYPTFRVLKADIRYDAFKEDTIIHNRIEIIKSEIKKMLLTQNLFTYFISH